MKVVFCSSEVFPFAKTGGLADVCGALPLALEKQGIEVSLFLPHYRSIDNKAHQVQKIHENLSKTTLGKNISVYLIGHEEFFSREGLYGDGCGDYSDNLERFQYFCLETLAAFKYLNEEVDIVHCHDWQTALIPVYLKTLYGNDDFFSQTKTIVTIHNLAFQGVFFGEKYVTLKGSAENDHFIGFDDFEFYGKLNLLKAALLHSDQITTVSPQYAGEIQTKEFGCGLEAVLQNRSEEIVGILNGLDYDVWNPKTDPFIEKKYDVSNFVEAKQRNKLQLQKTLGLPEDHTIPVLGFVGRVSHQKGMDLLLEAMDEMLGLDLQIVILGQGEEKYIKQLMEAARRHSNKMVISLEFDENLAHKIYAGSDLFLMPSCFEPCGLSQMISFRYGTIPIVFKTGGLADTVIASDHPDQKGNGFVFENHTKEVFMRIIKKAVEVFSDKKIFNQLIRNAFLADFSWDVSALKYVGLYRNKESEK